VYTTAWGHIASRLRPARQKGVSRVLFGLERLSLRSRMVTSPRYGCKVLQSACLYVCLSVCRSDRVSQKLACSNFTKFFVPYYVIYGRGSLLFDGNAMLCTSVIVDDVMFYAMERMGQNLRHFVQVAAPETAPTASCYKCMNLHAPPSGSIRNKVSP